MSEQPADVPSTPVLTAFFVVVERSGGISVFTNDLPPIELDHTATLRDVEMFAAQASREASRLLDAEALKVPEPEPSAARVEKAIKRRKQAGE